MFYAFTFQFISSYSIADRQINQSSSYHYASSIFIVFIRHLFHISNRINLNKFAELIAVVYLSTNRPPPPLPPQAQVFVGLLSLGWKSSHRIHVIISAQRLNDKLIIMDDGFCAQALSLKSPFFSQANVILRLTFQLLALFDSCSTILPPPKFI